MAQNVERREVYAEPIERQGDGALGFPGGGTPLGFRRRPLDHSRVPADTGHGVVDVSRRRRGAGGPVAARARPTRRDGVGGPARRGARRGRRQRRPVAVDQPRQRRARRRRRRPRCRVARPRRAGRAPRRHGGAPACSPPSRRDADSTDATPIRPRPRPDRRAHATEVPTRPRSRPRPPSPPRPSSPPRRGHATGAHATAEPTATAGRPRRPTTPPPAPEIRSRPRCRRTSPRPPRPSGRPPPPATGSSCARSCPSTGSSRRTTATSPTTSRSGRRRSATGSTCSARWPSSSPANRR